MKTLLKENRILLSIIFVGAILRVLFINWGLPELYEEATPLTVSWKLWNFEGKGFDFNPHFFNYPALTFYLNFAVQAIHYWVGHLLGFYSSLQDFGVTQDPLIISSRLLTVVFEVATIIAVFLLAQELSNKKTALIASALLAFNPLHIQQAHLIQVDSPLAFFCTLSLYFIVRSYRQPSNRNYLLSGITIGLAAASKYTGAFLIPVFLVSHLLRFSSFKLALNHLQERKLLVGLIASAFTFFLLNPYIILSFNEFLADFSFEQYHVSYGHLGLLTTESTIGYYLFDVFGNQLSWLVYAFVFVGAWYCIKQKEKRNYILLSFPVIFLIVLSSWQMRAERYILPAFPTLLVIASIGIFFLFDLIIKFISKHKEGIYPASKTMNIAVASVFALLFLIQPTMSNYRNLRSLTLPDTRTLTKKWIQENIKQGSVIASGPYGVYFDEKEYITLKIPFISVETEKVAPFYDARWYDEVDVLITSDYDGGRFRREPERFKDFLSYYASLNKQWNVLFEITPSDEVTGPSFKLYRCPKEMIQPSFDESLLNRLQSNPESLHISKFLKQLNLILYRKGKLEKSSQLLREILTVEVENIALRNQLASVYFELERYDDALQQLQVSLKYNPKQAGVFGLAGRALLRLNKMKEAEATLVKALNMDPKNEAAYEDLYQLYFTLKRPDNMRVVLEQYAKILPPNSPKREIIKKQLGELPQTTK
ncbi:MAG: glycosyltransferase family 39 protein [Ignavibacteriae bacterium]|nr:glycosyltransferase family 39 protein [Ignavibacteriota bacterium]